MTSEALWLTLDPLRQLLRLQDGAAPLSWTAAAAVVMALRRDRKGLGVLAAAVVLAYILDPSWPYLPAVALSLAVLSLARPPRPAPYLALAALCVVLAAEDGASHFLREREAAQEAAFVRSRLTGADLLLTLHEPPRGFRRALRDAVPWKTAFWPRGLSPTPPHDGGLDAAEPGALDARLNGGAKVWLASDRFFRRPGGLSEEESADVDRLLKRLSPLEVGAPEISPQGLYYYPLTHAPTSSAR